MVVSYRTGTEKMQTCLQLRTMLRHLFLPAVTAFSRHFLKLADFLLCFVYCLNQSQYSLWANRKQITSPFILFSWRGDFNSNFSEKT
jgi:hypothetical protein